MMSAIGSKESKRASAEGGFTLIEILLVLALIALAAGVVIVNFTAFADRNGSATPEETLRSAVRQARFAAASQQTVTNLSYNLESGKLEIRPGGEELTINEDFGPNGRGQIKFYLIPPAEGLSPFRDPDRERLEAPSVAFAPDRSSSPFVAEIDSGSGTPTRLQFDPFSSVVRTGK